MSDEDLYLKVYDILAKHVQAPMGYLRAFLWCHTKEVRCDEFRIEGLLGFGGKYRRKSNTVDCYPEDLNTERDIIIKQTNTALHQLDHLVELTLKPKSPAR